MNRDYTLKVVGLKDMSGGNGSPLEVQVSVVLTDVSDDGDGPMENPRVFGPWRSREGAQAAKARLDKATGEHDGFTYEIATLEPEWGGRWSLTGYLKRVREQVS